MRLRAQARWWWSALAVTGVPALAPTAHAQGFGLNEIGSCAIGRGFAVTAATCEDASSLYWNPGAVFTVPNGVSTYVGGTAVQVKGNFKADGSGTRYDGDVPVEVPPFAGITFRTEPRLVLGLAAYVPYGLTSQWKDDFPGRFSARRAALKTFYFQPTAAYELIPNRLSVGVGGIVGYSTLELRQALDLSSQALPAPLRAGLGLPATATFGNVGITPGTEFGYARVHGDGWGIGYNLGAQLKLSDALTLGARYLSQVRFDYHADAEFTVSQRAGEIRFPAGNVFQLPANTPLATLVAPNFAPGAPLGPNQNATTSIKHPAQFQVGLAYTGLRNTTLEADYDRTQWDAFQTLPVNFTTAAGLPNAQISRTLEENYGNSDSYRVGLEHRFGRGAMMGLMKEGVAGRLGFSYTTTPAPDETVTPLLPDMDRYNFNAGLGIPLGGRASLDLGYLRVETEGRRGRTGERPVGSTAPAEATNNGFYSLNANVFSASLKARLF